MAKSALIVGPSGSGKSTAGRNLDPTTTFWINVANKELPFRSNGYKSIKLDTPPKNLTDAQLQGGLETKVGEEYNMAVTDDTNLVIALMTYISDKRPEIKTIIIDDSQYLAAFEYMRKANVKGFDKFTLMGQNIFNLANAKNNLRDDLILFYITHADEFRDAEGNLSVKAKTLGKVVDNVVTLEGMYTIVLYTGVEINKDKKPEYVIYTENNGTNTCKSPMEMFSEPKIPNDLNVVDSVIREYYEI